MSGRKSRNKGHNFERKMAEELRPFFPNVCTARAESKKLDDRGVDLAFTQGFNFQCKAVEKLSPSYHDILKQMPDDEDLNVILHKRNRKGVTVTMDLDSFKVLLTMLKRLDLIN
jgi:hypothetical protein